MIELHAYKIGDSDPAPKFEVIEQPNDFVKVSKSVSAADSMNKSQTERLAFWNLFNEEIIAHGKPFNVRKATTDHWYDVAIGNSYSHISITLVNSDSYIGIELYIGDKKELFDNLSAHKDEIEAETGLSFDWQRLDNKKASRILHRIDGLNFGDHSNYHTLMDDVIKKVIIIRDVFKEHI